MHASWNRATIALWAVLTGFVGSASAFDVKVNFQNAAAAVPAGYVRDFGEPYALRTGANQGGGTLTYGWVVPGTATALNLSVGGSTPGNGRDRNLNSDQRLDTLMHMQGDDVPPTFNGTAVEGAWEIAVPAGTYIVTFAVGDAQQGSSPEIHRINVEGQTAITNFIPSGANGSATRHAVATATVPVADGRLTLDATGGGFNTKIHYVEIVDATEPSVSGMTPLNGAVDVPRDAFVAATVSLPNPGGIDEATLDASTVQLVRASDGTPVPASRNTSGGGDIIVVQATGLLEANTRYIFTVTTGLKDVFGNAFVPFVGTFTTGTAGGPVGGGPVSFTKVAGVATGARYTVLEVGPDGKLYGGTVLGQLRRWTINPDGTLSGEQIITSIQTANGGERAIIGLRFDPAATAGNLILWVTHSGAPLTGSADWLGKITRLSGPNLATVQDYVVNLPRSARDHMTNGIDFRPGEPTVLYVVQGSNSAMGAPDNAWGNRPERLLSGAVLRVDLAAITNPPLDVKTEEGGAYDPYAPGAPLTIFGSGTRNCYDLVWHSNGQLYVPCNGSAAGGNTPPTPTPLPAACSTRRLDLAQNGPYTGPAVPGITNVTATQNDFLFRVVQGGYYGHPNPQRCEWVLNGGNPTSGTDVAQVAQYPVGTQPDRNWRGASYNFGNNYSPDGIIEYRSNAFGGALTGRLLVTRFSGGNDIIALTPGAPTLDIVTAQTGITGTTGFIDPLGIVEHQATGNLYVTEYEAQRVTLLRADTPATTECVTAADCTGTLPACGVFACVAGTCQVAAGSMGTTCRAAAPGGCDVAEACDGVATTCPADGFAAAGTVCRAGSGDGCDPAEACTGSGPTCPANVVTATGTTCRAAAPGGCDVAEACTGVAGQACPADGFAAAGTVCRAGSGDSCDPAETCTGSGPTCPANVVTAAGATCRAAAAGGCDVAEACTGVAGQACPANGFAPASTVCRAAAPGGCDVAETCTGSGATCPANGFAPASTVCRAAAPGGCDVAETCTGGSAACPADGFAPASTVCRAAAPGGCDVVETCTGGSAACPADGFAAAGTVCRAGADLCDVAETCTGGSATCPADGVAPAGTQCRATTGVCDVAETCDGNNAACPPDAPAPDGTSCSDGNVCTVADACEAGVCTGDSVTCGNGTVEGGCGEECDDGNTTGDDGCDATCRLEVCPPTPGVGCRPPTVGRAAQLKVKRVPGSTKNQMKFKYKRGAATTKAEFGAPTATDDYWLCVYDAGALESTTRMEAAGDCGGRPCWKELSTGFLFKDKELTPDGAQQLKLREGADGKSSVQFKGKGAALDTPGAAVGPVVVQVRQAGGAACWEATFPAPFQKNDGTTFIDKTD